ncbi:MAG: hypothetical protein ABL908_19615, partial [Hyphomicrobium sp.]
IQNRGSSIAAADGITVVAQDLISQDVVANTFTDNGRKSCGLFGCKGMHWTIPPGDVGVRGGGVMSGEHRRILPAGATGFST